MVGGEGEGCGRSSVATRGTEELRCGKGGPRGYRRGGAMWKREGCEGSEGVCAEGDIRLCNCETPAPAISLYIEKSGTWLFLLNSNSHEVGHIGATLF